MLQTSITLAHHLLLMAWRTRFFVVLGLILLTLLGLSIFAGLLAISEHAEFQVSLLAASMRLFIVYLLSVWLISHVLHEFNNKNLYLLLALPMPRQGYLLGKFFGVLILALLCAILASSLLLFYSASWYSVLLWGLSFTCELLMMGTVSLLCALSFRHTSLALTAALAFYMLARSMQGFLNLGEHLLQPNNSWLDQGISGFLSLLALMLPSLDRFSNSAWLVYQQGSFIEVGSLMVQTGIYLLLLLGLGFIDLARKNF